MYILSRININISLYGNRMENTIVFDVNNVVVDTKEQPDVVIKKNKVVKKRKSYTCQCSCVISCQCGSDSE